jgi:hypothetical protein
VNERIRELMIQSNPDGDFSGSEWVFEKFAEFLVKDILVIVENYCETTPEIWGLPVEIVDHFDMEIEQ